MNKRIFLPGATIGILGSGQLGRMLALVAKQMGYRVHVFSPDNNSPTGQVADVEICASYGDMDAVERFAESVDVITYEFENIPIDTMARIANIVPVRPGLTALHIAQNRWREKWFCQTLGLPVTPFIKVISVKELRAGLEKLGTPAVLKKLMAGYDGKGQIKINHMDEAESAWEHIQPYTGILEQYIPFERELSMIGVRGYQGDYVNYGLIDNRHVNHILDVSVAPANVSPELVAHAEKIVYQLLKSLGIVGILCVEFFLTNEGELLINELAPRPHNSGHLTIDACTTSQFEQHLRATCGLPLGDTTFLKPAAMSNIMGELWHPQPPNWQKIYGQKDIKLHLYGKSPAREGRKMGHLTATADTIDEAAVKVKEARALLTT